MITYEKHRSFSPNYIYHQYDENLQFISHFHDSFELVYVYEGQLNVTIEKDSFKIKAGHCLLILPNQIHSYSTKKYSKTFILIFGSSYVSKFYKYSLQYCSTHPYFSLKGKEYLLEHLQPSDDIYLQKSALYYIVHLYMQSKSICRNNKYNSLMQQVLTYIYDNYQKKITFKTLAKYLGYDYNYLSGIINKGLDSNFLSFLNEYRVNKVCEAMSEDSQTPINSLAFNAGYSSLRTFNRNFVRFKKMTPVEYRQKIITDNL